MRPWNKQEVEMRSEKKEMNEKLSDLNKKVNERVKRSTWLELHGVDWMIILAVYAHAPLMFYLLSSTRPIAFVIGIMCHGVIHGVNSTRGAHMAGHNALCRSKLVNKFWRYFFCDFCSSFSSEFGMNAHIKVHHPHTNVVGLGDSSIWRVPKLPRIMYMFIAPLALPILSPVFSLITLVSMGRTKEALKSMLIMAAGLCTVVYLLHIFSGHSIPLAILTVFASRAVLAPSYVHVNIFQHIGMNMYSQQNRPPRIVLMTTGVLSIVGATCLDFIFGHSLISCHLEHHLYPHLSDNMCKIIKPMVKQYLLENDLPYVEDFYWNRLKIFVKHYDELMVNAPPITKYIGIP